MDIETIKKHIDDVLIETDFPELGEKKRGKVRDVYDQKDKLVLIATDRYSAFDRNLALIPFKGEIPHRSYPGMMSGRYPVNASKQFIYLLKALRGNVITNGLELEKTKIAEATANWASRPQKRGGARFKRTHVLLKAREKMEAKK